MVSLVLYQPDIPQNAGTMLRLAACLGVPVHIVGPAGFDVSDRGFRRAGMDYIQHAEPIRHVGWQSFDLWRRAAGCQRLVLSSAHGSMSYADFAFAADDFILVGRESAGVPEGVHAAADARLAIPMRSGLRSLNVAVAAAMMLGEALRQTGGFPDPAPAPAAGALPGHAC